jgi:hypothetical protein
MSRQDLHKERVRCKSWACVPLQAMPDIGGVNHTMSHFYIPASGVEDWRRLLADPDKHWRTGYSARALAHCWEAAGGFPPEVQELFTHSGNPAFRRMELLLAFPEHKVVMPPSGGHPSQNDLFALARDRDGRLAALTVEGKVSEPFGETLARWNAEGSPGKAERLALIEKTLGLTGGLPATIRYQLLHRTTSAVLEARRFSARSAMMVVHSFSQGDAWFEDFGAFLALFGVREATTGKLYRLAEVDGIEVYAGWARGREEFLRS